MAPAMLEEEEVVRAPAPKPHFLVVTFPAQGHINPARHLARRLVRATGARVTVSTAVSALHKMFPDAAAAAAADPSGEPEAHRDASGVWYVPFSDGFDDARSSSWAPPRWAASCTASVARAGPSRSSCTRCCCHGRLEEPQIPAVGFVWHAIAHLGPSTGRQAKNSSCGHMDGDVL